MSHSGLVSFTKLVPNSQDQPRTIAAGTWCLHTTSTVPMVMVSDGDIARPVTWGEVFTVERQAKIINASYHTGDAHFMAAKDVAAPRPAQYFLPVEWTTFVELGVNRARTQWLDVRNVRRAFLAINVANTDPLPLPIVIEHNTQGFVNSPGIGLAVTANSTAATQGGLVTEVRTLNTVRKYSLGFQARDIAPGDPYPHMLFAAVRVIVVTDPPTSFPLVLDPFFQIEF